ncbi:NAD(+) synthase [Candidatus Gracilibacteria bacterium]|nr:NAD(+) synthase [Candidatus Gracilibacteria bacterium]
MPSRNLDYTKVEESLVSGLRDYCNNAGQRGYVIGVSGGVDSAVVSTLCAKTGLPLYVVEMPIHQGEDEVNRAQEHIAWLKANFPNVIEWREDLTEVFDLMATKIAHVADTLEGANDTRLSLANTRSRLRMVSLYAMAGTFGVLVAGTGNKVEDYGIGFFTKFGDGGVDISPIAELYKSEVRELGRHMDIPSNLTEAVPTDGLHTDGSTDEDQIGATYPELEWVMPQYDAGKRVADFSGRAREVMAIYTTRHEVNAHKLALPPVLPVPVGE